MSITVFIIISFLVLGITFTVCSIKTAEVDEGHLDEQFDRKAFSKPAGWKVGKMPEALQAKNIARKGPRVSRKNYLFRDELEPTTDYPLIKKKQSV